MATFIDLPFHYDHSFLQFLNDLAMQQFLSPLFVNVRATKGSNGEVFLSKYFNAEMERINTPILNKAPSKICSCIAFSNFKSSKQEETLQQHLKPQFQNVQLPHPNPNVYPCPLLAFNKDPQSVVHSNLHARPYPDLNPGTFVLPRKLLMRPLPVPLQPWYRQSPRLHQIQIP